MSDEVVHLLSGASGGTIRARCGVTAKSERKLPSTFSSWASDVTCTSCVPAEVAEAKKAAAEAQAARMQTGDVTLLTLPDRSSESKEECYWSLPPTSTSNRNQNRYQKGNG